MVKTLVFDTFRRTASMAEEVPKKFFKREVTWTHLTASEDEVIGAVVKEFGQTGAFEEDLLEEQRPRLTSFNTYSVAILSVPTKKILEAGKDEEGSQQVSFIITDNRLVSVTKEKFWLVDKIMEQMQKKPLKKMSATTILSYIIDRLIENVIDVIELLEKEVDKMQLFLMKGERGGNILERVEQIKENLFYNHKMLRADYEVVHEIIGKRGKFIEARDLEEHIEDRILYSMDLLDAVRASIEGLNTLYLTSLSNNLNNHMYRLTIIGALLLIPTVVSGFFGMNLDLPAHNFWSIVILSLFLAGVFAMLLRVWIRK